jgi:hypothetical protein
MESTRKAKPGEAILLDLLVSKSTQAILPIDWKNSLLVQPMDDGGMGSLRLIDPEKIQGERKLGEQVSEHRFDDDDGVPVIATLYTDADGYLYELDIWKVDFSPLICLKK